MQQRGPYWHMKVARYCNSFSGSIPPNFEHNYVAIDKHLEKLLPQFYQIWMKIYHRVLMTSELSQQRNDAIVYFTCNKIFTATFLSNSRVDVREVKTESIKELSGYFGMKFQKYAKKNLDVWPLSVENESLLTCNFTSQQLQSF